MSELDYYSVEFRPIRVDGSVGHQVQKLNEDQQKTYKTCQPANCPRVSGLSNQEKLATVMASTM